MCLDPPIIPAFVEVIDHPGDRLAQRFTEDRPAGLPDGRQAFECPVPRTALPQLTYQDAVRQEDHVQMAGLPLAIPELTVSYRQATDPRAAYSPAKEKPEEKKRSKDIFAV